MSLRTTPKRKQPLYKLNEEEINDPLMVIDELFDFAHLPRIRNMLWDWLKATVTGSYPKSLTANERATIILLYEKIEKLIEAAQVIKDTRNTGNKRR